MNQFFRYFFVIIILWATSDPTLQAIEVEQLPLKSLKQKFDISPCLNIQKFGVQVEKTHLSRKWYLENIQMNLRVPSNNLNSCSEVDLIYGWTETWAIGATIPWQQKKQSSSLTFSGVNQTAELQTVERNVASDSQTGLGDVALWMRYNISSSYRWLWTLTPKLVFPTGVTGKARGFKPVATGDGQMDLGLKLQSQWYPPPIRGCPTNRFG